MPAAPHLPLVRDLALWDRVVHALAGNRFHDLLDLVIAGSVVPLPADTPLVIEEDLATLVRVRVVAGDARGTVGWLPSGRLQYARAA